MRGNNGPKKGIEDAKRFGLVLNKGIEDAFKGNKSLIRGNKGPKKGNEDVWSILVSLNSGG